MVRRRNSVALYIKKEEENEKLRKEEENKIRQNHKEIQEVTEKKIQPNPPRV